MECWFYSKVLLDLGQSPNTRDKADLTPLYYAVLNNSISLCVERLLFDHSPLGISDEAGLQEIHQACRFGRVQHLEILLAYGADINVQTSKNGNTPLHICAYTGQESCARMLLFRGADKAIRNFNGHTAYEQAMISGNTEIADLIKNFNDQDVVPIREYPKRNQRRRSFSRVRSHQRCASMGRLNDISNHKQGHNGVVELNNLTTYDQDHCDTLKGNCTNRNNTWMSNSISGYHLNSVISDSMEFNDNKDNMATVHGRNHHLAQSGSVFNLNRQANSVNKRLPHTEDPMHPNHASTIRTTQGRREGRSSTPAACHSSGDSLKMSHVTDRHSTYRPTLDLAWMSQSNENGSDTASIFSVSSSIRTPSTNSVKNTSAILQLLLANRDSIADLDTTNLPRMIALQRGSNGFGFVVRGKRGTSGNFVPTLECPASQYLEKIEPHSAASRAGLKAGDFILEVNGINVTTMSHEAVVALIRGSSDILGLKVITVDAEQITTTPTLEHQSLNGNRFCESSDNLYNSKTRKHNYEHTFSNDCCNSPETNWSINIDNNCRTICRDSFHKTENCSTRQSNKLGNKPLLNGFVSTNKLNTLRRNTEYTDRNEISNLKSSQISLASYKTPVPPPIASKPTLNCGTLTKNGQQNNGKTMERKEVNMSINSNEKSGYNGRNCESVNGIQNTPIHPPPPMLPTVSSSISASVPPPPPIFIPTTKSVPTIKPEIPTGILKKSSSALNELTEISKPSKCSPDNRSQDDWSDQLSLPPPPPPDEFELNTPEKEIQPQCVKNNYNNGQETCKIQSSPKASKLSSFEDNLRKAVAQRRRMIEMASEDEEQDFEPMHYKSCQSTLYTESTIKTTKQQDDSLPQNENSFKLAAEKFHQKALSRNLPSNGTIPPPEKFKDSNKIFSKFDGNTEAKIGNKPVLPQWQSSLMRNANKTQYSVNSEEKISNGVKASDSYLSIKSFQNNGTSNNNDNTCSDAMLKEVTTFKQNSSSHPTKVMGNNTAPPPPPPPLLFVDTPKVMWSTRKNDSVKSLVR
ncbi:unnamed protein product [Trichobilharzia szidati]|nr:unnamed protein product [Trichobilharzia szidati]CAH8872417.1 unnamed protein product [Trichobilharzia szidati]